MNDKNDKATQPVNDLDWSLETLAIRSGHRRTHEDEHSEPLFLTSSYVFNSCEEAAARFKGETEGNVYSRYTNPTVAIFEHRLAALEGAEECVATASGMGAILSLCLAHLKQGDHMICSQDVFGSTVVLLDNFFVKFGIEVTYLALNDIPNWKDSIKNNTRLIFVESPSNPLNEVADFSVLSQLAKTNDVLLAVDNCFCSPALQQPLTHGADIVIHSATKYIDGQGRCLGGAVLGSSDLVAPVRSLVRAGGPAMSPFNAWVFTKGLETLSLRMKAHSENARNLALWLTQQSWVEKVYYAGLSSHASHNLAKRQQKDFGGVLSFLIKVESGDDNAEKNAAWRFIDASRMLSHTANLGDTKTTIVHPATTTHGRLSPEQRKAAGIADNLVRIAVGLEALDDIKADLMGCAKVLQA